MHFYDAYYEHQKNHPQRLLKTKIIRIHTGSTFPSSLPVSQLSAESSQYSALCPTEADQEAETHATHQHGTQRGQTHTRSRSGRGTF